MNSALAAVVVAAVLPSGSVEEQVRGVEDRVFAAMAAKDANALANELADGFVLTSPGKPDQDRTAFVEAVVSMPFKIVAIAGEGVRFGLVGDVAVLSGVQSARVELAEGQVVVARTAFVDLFVLERGKWKLQHAFGVEMPNAEDSAEQGRALVSP